MTLSTTNEQTVEQRLTALAKQYESEGYDHVEALDAILETVTLDEALLFVRRVMAPHVAAVFSNAQAARRSNRPKLRQVERVIPSDRAKQDIRRQTRAVEKRVFEALNSATTPAQRAALYVQMGDESFDIPEYPFTVTWLESTEQHHRARMSMLHRQIAGIQENLPQHQQAITDLKTVPGGSIRDFIRAHS